MSIAKRLAAGLPFFYGWIVLAVGFVTLGLAYSARSTFSLLYPPILNEHRLTAGDAIAVDGDGGSIPVMPFEQFHGDIRSLGFRFGDVAYSSDLKGLPHQSEVLLEDLDVWILDALRYRGHSSHLSLEEAVALAARFKPRRVVLTNMHLDLDYETLRRSLPPGIEPAYDLMSFRSNMAATRGGSAA